tara:strand:- start:47633 stop:48541 length:909 start_codon:yes stop_codon:yes gene_type:complete
MEKQSITGYQRKFSKVVIWGLRDQWHTHRFIHSSFYSTLRKLGFPCVWVEDLPDNCKYVKSGDLVIAVGEAAKYLPYNSNAFYCLHNLEVGWGDSEKVRKLQVFTKGVLGFKNVEKINKTTVYNHDDKTLYQAWGTNLLKSEFKEPVFSLRSPLVFWVGSVWNNELNQGNQNEINYLKSALKRYGVGFCRVSRVPDSLNSFLVRNSRVAPAIASGWQVSKGYLPCRLFKNISYGQLGFSNVREFELIFGDNDYFDRDISNLVDNVMSLGREKFVKNIIRQQEYIQDHTYESKIENIMNSFYM